MLNVRPLLLSVLFLLILLLVQNSLAVLELLDVPVLLLAELEVLEVADQQLQAGWAGPD